MPGLVPGQSAVIPMAYFPEKVPEAKNWAYLQKYRVSEEESGQVRFRGNITEGTAVFTDGI